MEQEASSQLPPLISFHFYFTHEESLADECLYIAKAFLLMRVCIGVL